LITCASCEKQISSNATACPGCGKMKTIMLLFLAFIFVLPLNAQKARTKITGIGGYNLGSIYFTQKKKTDDRNIYRVQAKQKKNLFNKLTIETNQKGIIYRIFASVDSNADELDRLFEQTVLDLKKQYNVSENEEIVSPTSYIFNRDGRMIHVWKHTGGGAYTSIGANAQYSLNIEFNIVDRKPSEKPLKKIF